MLLVFALLMVLSLALWAAGEPAPTVFAAALPAWAAFATLLAPLLRRYRAAMGIAARLEACEASALRAMRLRLTGLKVVALGALTSALPFAAAAAQWLSGQDLSLVLAPPAAGRVGFAVGAAVFALPFVISWLHLDALREAAETTPAGTPPAEPAPPGTAAATTEAP